MFHQQALRRMSRGEADQTYLNPVLPGFNPDPSVVRVGKDYFLVTSSFEYTPGAPVYHSTDLIQWTLIGHALTRRSQLDIKAPEPGGGVWAVTLRHHNDTFYVTTCVWDRYRPQESYERAWPRGFYVKTKDIWDSDSWSDPVYFDQPGFDQDLFWDDDGKVYLSTTHMKVDRPADSKLKHQAIHICTVDLETGNSTSPSTMVRESLVGSGVSEGSHLLKKGNYYYLFTAEGGTESGHSEYCFRSETSPLGPWEACPHNPLVQNTTEMEVQNTGHCDFVEDSLGRWWAFCLAVRPEKNKDSGEFTNSVCGRETFLMPVSWTDDEWPTLNYGKPISLIGTANARGLYMYDFPHKWHDNFLSSRLQLGWYRKNTPLKPDSDMSLSEGYLRIHPGPYKLSSPASPTALFRKQQHKEGIWKTRLLFQPDKARTEAGTCIYWNYFTWSSIGIRKAADGGREIGFSTQDGTWDTAKLESDISEVDLAIRCQRLHYSFGYHEVKTGATKVSADADIMWLGQISTSAMTKDPPCGNPFTGMMFGLYAFAEMQRGMKPADFAFAEFI